MTIENVVQLEPPSNGLVPTRAHRAINAALKRALVMGADGITVITGIPGIGKTATIKAFASGKPNVAVCTLSRLTGGGQTGLIRICNALGDQMHAKGVNLEDTLKRRLHAMRRKDEDHWSLLIIDEAQHASIDLLEEIRHLWDEVECGIALVGNAQLRDAIDQTLRVKHPQISSRFSADVDLDALDSRDLELFCKSYNLAPAAVERVRELVKLGGALRTVKNLLSIVSERRGEHAGRIDRQHVEEAAMMMGLVK